MTISPRANRTAAPAPSPKGKPAAEVAWNSRSAIAFGPKHIEMALVSIVTAAVRARAAPDMVAPVFSVMLASARMFPANSVFVPRVAELPTCHHTLQALPPPDKDNLGIGYR